MEVISQVDGDLADFLLSGPVHDELNNTFLFLVSDHGNRIHKFFF